MTTIGHNSGVVDAEKLEAEKKRLEEFEAAAADWNKTLKAQGGEILNDEQAARLNDFIAGARKAWKATDAVRKAEKSFYDEQSKKVQAIYVPLLDALKKIGADMTAPIDAYMVRKQEELRARQEAERKAAQEAEAEARRLSEAAQDRGDYLGAAEAAEAAKAAEKAAQAASKPQSASVASFTGGGRTRALRTYRSAKVKSWRIAFMAVEDDPRVREAIQSALNAKIRAKGFAGEIPGVEIIEERKSA